MTEQQTTMIALPPVGGTVLADSLDVLPPRLRKRLDSMAQRAAEWPLEQAGDGSGGGDGAVVARVDEETTVTVRIHDGVLRSADDVVCDCLLAPACLHRAALISLAPPYEETASAGTAEEAMASEGGTEPGAEAAAREAAGEGERGEIQEVGREVARLTTAELAAAQGLWDAGTALLLGGVIGSGLFTEAQLRRVAHQARALGLHRAATLGNQVAAGLRAARERRSDFALSQLVADLRELMLLARSLLRAVDADELAQLRGIGRRGYDSVGNLRLYGLFCEPVIVRSGHAGVVTYLVDDAGTLWTTANVMPGEADRVRPAYNAGVGLGGTVLSHRELVRAGLIVSGASASADGRLSGGGGARAVKASGAQWTESPIGPLFEAPLVQQVERAFAVAELGSADGSHSSVNGRAGEDLIFAAVRVLGQTEFGFAALTRSGETVHCVSGQVGYNLPFRHNLEALGRPGLCLRIVARLDHHRPATLRVLAASPDAVWPEESPEPEPQDAGKWSDLALPPQWDGRINLGFETMTVVSSDPTAEGKTAADRAELGQGDGSTTPPPDGTAMHLLRHRIEQAVAGGREITATAIADRDTARLRRSALHTAADLLTELSLAAPVRRDPFGRPVSAEAYVSAWLAAAHYESVASRRLLLRRWLRP